MPPVTNPLMSNSVLLRGQTPCPGEELLKLSTVVCPLVDQVSVLPRATVEATRFAFDFGVQAESFIVPLTVPVTRSQVTLEVQLPVQLVLP